MTPRCARVSAGSRLAVRQIVSRRVRNNSSTRSDSRRPIAKDRHSTHPSEGGSSLDTKYRPEPCHHSYPTMTMTMVQPSEDWECESSRSTENRATLRVCSYFAPHPRLSSNRHSPWLEWPHSSMQSVCVDSFVDRPHWSSHSNSSRHRRRRRCEFVRIRDNS